MTQIHALLIVLQGVTKIMLFYEQMNEPNLCFWAFPQLFSTLKLPHIWYSCSCLGSWSDSITWSEFTCGRISANSMQHFPRHLQFEFWWSPFNVTCTLLTRAYFLIVVHCVVWWFISSGLWFLTYVWLQVSIKLHFYL